MRLYARSSVLLTECDYMQDHVDDAMLAIRQAVEPEAESAKQELLRARGVREVLRAAVREVHGH